MGEGLKIQLVEIEKVKPYAQNPKTHSGDQVVKLAKQIDAHGFDQPIVIDGDYVIIKGHGRLLAAQHLGWTHVPVIIRDDLTPEQVRLARIADNKLAEQPWDWNNLKNELQAVDVGDIDLGDLSGFDAKELEAMMAPYAAGPVDYDEEAKEFERTHGTNKASKWWLYVEFETEEEFNQVKNALGKGTGRKIDVDKLKGMVESHGADAPVQD